MSDLQEPEWIFPFDYIKIGDSFFVPTMETAQMVHAIESGAKKAKIAVKVYITQKENHLGVRAWRIA